MAASRPFSSQFLLTISLPKSPRPPPPKPFDLPTKTLDKTYLPPVEVKIPDDFPPPANKPVDYGPPTDKPAPGGPVIKDPGPGKEDVKKDERREARVVCRNYPEIQALLADRFPVIADREDFNSRGISRFDMAMTITVGPGGEIKNPVMRQTSNAFAGRAMQSTVLAALKKLRCDGQSSDVAVDVPLSFTLAD